MATNIIKCWELRTEDWGHGTTHECYIVDEIEANIYASKNHSTIHKATFTLHDTCSDAMDAKQKKIIERALSKLNDEEKRALGYHGDI